MKVDKRQLWGPPILIGVSTAVGLIVALLADGIWNWCSGVLLAVPITVALWSVGKRQERK